MPKKFMRRKKLHPITLSEQEYKRIEEYCEALGYNLTEEEVGDVMLPTISKDDRKGFIQRYKTGLKTIYQQKSNDLETSLKFYELGKCCDVRENTTLFAFLAGIPDLEYNLDYKRPSYIKQKEK